MIYFFFPTKFSSFLFHIQVFYPSGIYLCYKIWGRDWMCFFPMGRHLFNTILFFFFLMWIVIQLCHRRIAAFPCLLLVFCLPLSQYYSVSISLALLWFLLSRRSCPLFPLPLPVLPSLLQFLVFRYSLRPFFECGSVWLRLSVFVVHMSHFILAVHPSCLRLCPAPFPTKATWGPLIWRGRRDPTDPGRGLPPMTAILLCCVGEKHHQHSQLSHVSITPVSYRFIPMENSTTVLFQNLCSHCCSIAKSCPTLCNPMDCSTPDFPFLHYFPELAAETHVHWFSDTIQPCHPRSHQMAKVLELQF